MSQLLFTEDFTNFFPGKQYATALCTLYSYVTNVESVGGKCVPVDLLNDTYKVGATIAYPGPYIPFTPTVGMLVQAVVSGVVFSDPDTYVGFGGVAGTNPGASLTAVYMWKELGATSLSAQAVGGGVVTGIPLADSYVVKHWVANGVIWSKINDFSWYEIPSGMVLIEGQWVLIQPAVYVEGLDVFAEVAFYGALPSQSFSIDDLSVSYGPIPLIDTFWKFHRETTETLEQ